MTNIFTRLLAEEYNITDVRNQDFKSWPKPQENQKSSFLKNVLNICGIKETQEKPEYLEHYLFSEDVANMKVKVRKKTCIIFTKLF